MNNLGVISEASYLSTGNTPQYRRIMRIFFEEYEKVHYQLCKEDVLERLREYPGYEDYSVEQLKVDLNMLVEWKNLTPIQDPRRVYTIEDYKNKQYQYSMSEYAVEIERLTVRLETLFIEGGTLSSSYILRIEEALLRVQQLDTLSLKEVNEWWSNLQEDFKRLNQNYQDYLREFYSEKAEKILKSVEFILHKDRFIAYLKEFVRELQVIAARIEGYLQAISGEREEKLLEKVVRSELEVPHPLSEKTEEPREESIRRNVRGKWEVLRAWFVSSEGRPSVCSRVLDITDEIIRKIIQNAALIVQLQNWGISRKDDYQKFLSLFLDCEDVDEAHRLSAHVFGIQQIRHYKVNDSRSTDSIHSSVYEEEPSEYMLKPRTRSFRPRVDRTGFENKSLQKLAQRQDYLAQAERDRQMVMRYIRNGKLAVADIDDIVPAFLRETLLRWISAANLSDSRRGRTEYGQEYTLLRREGTCTLRCEDGDLTLPDYVFVFV
ncbi:MAG: TIGR02677 family protein [Lachnospiraceae bacterium]|nr:TIGR02677 family protein [Lachnospiraceae bacterium]